MKKFIVANWKMNPTTYEEAKKLTEAVLKAGRELKSAETVLCPPFVWLTDLSHKYYRSISFGAQDVFWKTEGAFTGEISPLMLVSSRVSYVIIGHSERRALGETDEAVNKKVEAALHEGLKVILCIGEPRTVRDRGIQAAKQFVKKQLERDLKGITHNSQLTTHNLIIAYEPVWAISAVSGGKSDTPENALEMIRFIKKLSTFNFQLSTKVLYGGSVNAKNALGFLNQKEIDGALVGGASLKAREFRKIVGVAARFCNT